jgi:cold shock CspA family protein
VDKGKVTWFDDRGWGFLEPSSGIEPIHFHQDFQREVFLNWKNEIIISRDQSNKKFRRKPKVGDIIQYKKNYKEKGPVADRWYFDDEYQNILTIQSTIQSNLNTVYRLMKNSRNGGEEVWRGTSVDELSDIILNKITKPFLFKLNSNLYWLEKKIQEREWRRLKQG